MTRALRRVALAVLSILLDPWLGLIAIGLMVAALDFYLPPADPD